MIHPQEFRFRAPLSGSSRDHRRVPDILMSPKPQKDYPAENARQGFILLRHWWSRAIFFGALALIVVVVAVWGVP